jgi:carbamoyl-phosphate synthase small subunit
MIRSSGSMRGAIIVNPDEQVPDFSEKDKNLVRDVTCVSPYTVECPEAKCRLAVMDFGTKKNILRELNKFGCELTVYPAFTPADEVLSSNPDAVFLTNGPGDPKDIPSVIETVRQLMEAKPVLGICLGHQLIALALGCDTVRMKFGHHGGNHPVKDLRSGRVYITAQNHNYVVTQLTPDLEVTHINVNDNTIEGIRHKTKPIMSVQFHPEAAPGPVDTEFLFKDFLGAAFAR